MQGRIRAASLSLPSAIYAGFLIFSVLGWRISKALNLDQGWIAPLAGAATLVSGVLSLWLLLYIEARSRTLSVLGILLVFGFSCELCGLATGVPFGLYRYTGRWWPSIPLGSLGPFPLLLPFAWVSIVGACSVVSSWPKRFGPLARIVFGGLLAALIDLLMEPTFIHSLGYWRWLKPGPLPGHAPVANFVGWFLVGSGGCAILERFRLPIGEKARTAAMLILAGQLILSAGLA